MLHFKLSYIPSIQLQSKWLKHLWLLLQLRCHRITIAIFTLMEFQLVPVCTKWVEQNRYTKCHLVQNLWVSLFHTIQIYIISPDATKSQNCLKNSKHLELLPSQVLCTICHSLQSFSCNKSKGELSKNWFNWSVFWCGHIYKHESMQMLLKDEFGGSGTEMLDSTAISKPENRQSKHEYPPASTNTSVFSTFTLEKWKFNGS